MTVLELRDILNEMPLDYPVRFAYHADNIIDSAFDISGAYEYHSCQIDPAEQAVVLIGV